MVNAKQKGNRSELKIAKIFTEKFGKGFSRSPNSGAFGSTHSKTLSLEADVLLSGDFITPSDFSWSLENKSGYQIELLKLFMFKSNSTKTTVKGFLKQASIDADRVGRLPMVLYSKDFCDTIAIFPTKNNKKTKKISSLRKKMRCFLTCKFKIEEFPKWDTWGFVNLEELLEKTTEDFFFENCN